MHMRWKILPSSIISRVDGNERVTACVHKVYYMAEQLAGLGQIKYKHVSYYQQLCSWIYISKKSLQSSMIKQVWEYSS